MNYQEIVDKIKKLQMNYDRAIARKADQRAKRYMNEIKDLTAQKEAFEKNNQQDVIEQQLKAIANLESQLEGATLANQGLQEKIAELQATIDEVNEAIEPEPEIEPEPVLIKCTKCEHMIPEDEMVAHQALCIAKSSQ